MPTTTSPFTWGAIALSAALLADPVAAQLTPGNAPGRRDHTSDGGGHCFHDLNLDGETCDD